MSSFHINRRLLLPEKPILLNKRASFKANPVCVGGVGGSGTRVVAEVLENLGVFIGSNINESKDNFDLPLNQKLSGIDSLVHGYETIADVLEAFESKMHSDSMSKLWGWKVPGSFYWLDYLSYYFQELRYIHVIRSGLDMAFSANTNQLRNWGPFFCLNPGPSPSPKEVLDYWILANKFAIQKATKLLNHNFLLVRFDHLCSEPEKEVKRISDFLDINCCDEKIEKIARSVITPPRSIGRYLAQLKESDIEEYQVEEVREFGFSAVC